MSNIFCMHTCFVQVLVMSSIFFSNFSQARTVSFYKKKISLLQEEKNKKKYNEDDLNQVTIFYRSKVLFLSGKYEDAIEVLLKNWQEMKSLGFLPLVVKEVISYLDEHPLYKGKDKKYRLDYFITYYSKKKIIPEKELHEYFSYKEEKTKRKKITPKDQKITDPYLRLALKEYCTKSLFDNPKWDEWEQSLTSHKKIFWQASILACFKKPKPSLQKINHLLDLLKNSKTRTPLVFWAQHLKVKQQRLLGQRKEAYDTYKIILGYWKRSDFTKEDLDLSNNDFLLQEIDDYLWSSRYASLTGSIFAGIDHVNHALSLATTNLHNKKIKTALKDFVSEAIYIRTFRLGYSEKSLEASKNLLEASLKDMNFTKKWTEKYRWVLGLYYFIDQQYVKASKIWELSLNDTTNYFLKSKYHFWLMRAYKKTDNNDLEEYHRQFLTKKIGRTNYYETIYSSLYEKRDRKDSSLLHKFIKPSKEKELLNVYIKDPTLSPYFERIRLYLDFQIKEWLSFSVTGLFNAANKKYKIKNHIDLYLYLSRLLFVAGDVKKAIRLTHRMASIHPKLFEKNTEQIFILYPRPFRHIYNAAANKFSVEKALLYSISMQESLFDPVALSHAGARGLMQIMPHTATQLGLRHKKNIDSDLFKPDINIDLAGEYLSFLSQKYNHNLFAVIAAYNAGDYLANKMLTQRYHHDISLWIELIPFYETRRYVKNVWRNLLIYRSVENSSSLMGVSDAWRLGYKM